MPVSYCEKTRVFKLDTPNTSYIIGLCFNEQIPVHLYYGRYIDTISPKNYIEYDSNFLLDTFRDKASVMDRLPFEYPAAGLGDFREPCLIANKNGTGAYLRYVSHRIYNGKPALCGLPATYSDNCDTLELLCEDMALGLEIKLFYTAFNELDIITRHSEITNTGSDTVVLKRAYSACLELPQKQYDIIRLHGSWARERTLSRVPLGFGVTSASSVRGVSSHQSHPFIALTSPGASEESGEIYALNLVYSGNFEAAAELTQFGCPRVVIGVNDYNFSWELPPAGVFTTPEVVITYSASGFGHMTRTLHDLYRKHLIRGFAKPRPVLINNWEATYFNFNEQKLLQIAKKAAECGIELFVLDDGWFGKRNDDSSSLGDWVVNKKKLKGGLKYLSDELNKLGLRFGIWMEPEMVSPDSDLYRTHPDWAFALPGREPVQSRGQYVLDITRAEVREHVWSSIKNTLASADISYLKWDMNRPLTDVYSAVTTHGEIYHRYVLGLYELQERLVTEFPELLLENCSGGGGRFDPGMLYYSPQIWCSDNTDALCRLAIQEGTALIYPLSAIGAHVSICPNHVTGRTVSLKTRGIVALAGTFGYELDITALTEVELAQIKKQVNVYKKYAALIRNGDYYRLESCAANKRRDVWQVVSRDKRETLIFFVSACSPAKAEDAVIYPRGLDERLTYKNEQGAAFSARELMYAGFPVKNLPDTEAELFYFCAL